MTKIQKFIVLFAAASLAAPASAQLVRTAAPGAVPPAASVNDLAWLAGEWTGEGFDSVLHENWSGAVGGQMAGHFYAAKDGQPDFYELMMIARAGNSIEYRVRHFNPDMTGWEEKEKFVRFPLVAADNDSWYFDGLTIRRTGSDSADHIVRVKTKDGTERDVVIHYRRATR